MVEQKIKRALLALVLVVLSVSAGSTAHIAFAVDAKIVGVPSSGQNAIEFIGRIDQDGPNFTGYGFLTYVFDVPDSLLFTDSSSHTAATARITYVATGTATASGRADLEGIIVHNATGEITFYFND